MDFVTHTCKKCGRAFNAEDYTNAQDVPPHWRLCKFCCEELGIDYDSQTPKTNRTPEEQKRIDAQIERLKIAGLKTRFKKKQNV